jgi:hypothetical protein
MAKQRKNSATTLRFGPALKASFLCLVIGGSAVGYVWQKNEIYRLSQQIRQQEIRLTQVRRSNQQLGDAIEFLRSPQNLDRRAKELNLGLAPESPAQVVRLMEPSPENKNVARQLVQRPVDAFSP